MGDIVEKRGKRSLIRNRVERCRCCGHGGVTFVVRMVPHVYRGRRRYIEECGLWCKRCGESVMHGGAKSNYIREARDFEAEIEGRITTRDFERIRKKMMLSQAELARTLGISVTTIRRYESGASPIPLMRDLLFRILDSIHVVVIKLRMFNRRRVGGARLIVGTMSSSCYKKTNESFYFIQHTFSR